MLWLESEQNILFELQKKLKEKSKVVTIANRSKLPISRGREKGQNIKNKNHAQTKNAREAHRPAPSFSSEAYWAICDLLTLHTLYKRDLVQTRP